jgi:hypothetical protein
MLADGDYNNLLNYVNRGAPLWQHHLVAGAFSSALEPKAQEIKILNHKHRHFAVRATHEANSCVVFQDPLDRSHRTGFITRMWNVLLPPKVETFVMVTPHSQFVNDENDNLRGPFLDHPELQTKIVSTYLEDISLVIRPTDIIGQCVLWHRPRGIYNISEDFYVINFAAHRNRSHS